MNTEKAPRVPILQEGSRVRSLLRNGNFMVLSFKRAKELIDDPAIPDQEVEQILDACNSLARILFEKWRGEKAGKNY